VAPVPDGVRKDTHLIAIDGLLDAIYIAAILVLCQLRVQSSEIENQSGTLEHEIPQLDRNIIWCKDGCVGDFELDLNVHRDRRRTKNKEIGDSHR
jgi:hypothetical protein